MRLLSVAGLFGCSWLQVNRLDGLQHLHIPPGQTYVSPGTAYVEGDASSASYFLGGATITGGRVTVEGCGSESLQGDVRFAEGNVIRSRALQTHSIAQACVSGRAPFQTSKRSSSSSS